VAGGVEGIDGAPPNAGGAPGIVFRLSAIR
jgi:hypothetical protein